MIRMIARRCGGLAHAAVLGALAVLLTIYAGTKRPAVTWDNVLADAGSAIDTNDLRNVTFAWTYPEYIPAASAVSIYALPKSAADTNDMFLVATTRADGSPLSVQMPTDATNYLFWAECSYMPPTPVRTNGVYHLDAIKIDDTIRLVPLGVTIEDNGRRISPPEGTETP